MVFQKELYTMVFQMLLCGEYYENESDSRLSVKLVPNVVDRECHVVSVTDPYGRILGFLDRKRYYFFPVAPQFYTRG
jgi:hypothetical protein